jgi:hypothetical protein
LGGSLEGGLQGELQDDSSIVGHDFASVSEQHLLEIGQSEYSE